MITAVIVAAAIDSAKVGAAAASSGFAFKALAWVFSALGGTSVVAWAIKKWAVPAYRQRIRDALQKALNPDTPDPELNRRMRAHALTGVKLAEYLIPDRGKGGERFQWVDEQLARLKIPEPLRKVLIEEAVYAMDEELKAAEAQADAGGQGPAAPPAAP